MNDQGSDGAHEVSDAFLTSTRRLVERGLRDDSVDADRVAFFEALLHLQSDDLSAAVDGFRRASRSSQPPFDALSLVALAECQRLRGREAAAIKEWKSIADDPHAPHAARYVGWLSLASLAEKRQDQRLLNKANAALDQFGDH